MSSVKVCRFCSTVNEAESQFCRICGKEFENMPENTAPEPPQGNIEQSPAPQQYTPYPPSPPPYAPPYTPQYIPRYAPPPPYPQYTNPYAYANNANADPNIPIIDDITTAELAAFVGSKAEVYVPKFITMIKTRSKVNFNWVVFLLTFFLSPIVGSFWFFHRKIYKMGIALLAIGIILIATSFVSLIPMMNKFPDFFNKIATIEQKYGYSTYSSGTDGGTYNSSEYQKEIMAATADFYKSLTPMMIISSIISILTLAATVVFSIFADYWYKETAIKRIKEIKAVNGNDIGAISAGGGTQSLIWGIILVCYIIINITLVSILFVYFFGMIMDMLSKFPNTFSDAPAAFFSFFKK